MFILNQRRNSIISNVSLITFGKVETDSVRIYSDYTFIGEYKTKERAKEILLEIMKKAEVGNRVYYMPEE